MNFDWHKEGFAEPPVLRPATGAERLYRAWGGKKEWMLGNENGVGVCYSLDRASSRWDAERLSSVMEWQNPVRWITEFKTLLGLPLWVGRVHPGDDVRAVLGRFSGSQVFIERPYVPLLKVVSTDLLIDDLGQYSTYYGRPARLPS